jgi:CRP-like cAMP-binding protein
MNFRNLLLSHLSEDQYEAISPYLSEVVLPAGQVLYQAGDPVDFVYFPSGAVTSVLSVMKDGRCVESATIGYESMVGAVPALSGAPAHGRTIVQIGGSAVKMPAARLRDQAFASPGLLKMLLGFVRDDIAQAEQSVACNALHLASQRLARWLLLTQDRLGAAIVPLTQEYLSVMLGVQRTTVTATAMALKAAGLISYRRGQVEIIDRAGLERAACECYATSRTAWAPANQTGPKQGLSGFDAAPPTRSVAFPS